MSIDTKHTVEAIQHPDSGDIYVKLPGSARLIFDPSEHDDARRLVAVWNAAHDAGLSTESLEQGVVEELLRAVDMAETALAPVMANHECGDRPPSGARCGECIGCMNWATWELLRAAIALARGQQS